MSHPVSPGLRSSGRCARPGIGTSPRFSCVRRTICFSRLGPEPVMSIPGCRGSCLAISTPWRDGLRLKRVDVIDERVSATVRPNKRLKLSGLAQVG